jgi:hypothetical protein
MNLAASRTVEPTGNVLAVAVQSKEKKMPAKNPRINVVLDKSLFQTVSLMAKREGVSLSMKARDLLKDALEIHEDILLNEYAEWREASFNRSEALSHEDVWN